MMDPMTIIALFDYHLHIKFFDHCENGMFKSTLNTDRTDFESKALISQNRTVWSSPELADLYAEV
jgi:hypothetical protein